MKNMYDKYRGNWYLPVLKKVLELYQKESFSNEDFNSYLYEELGYTPSQFNTYIDRITTIGYFDEKSYQDLVKISKKFETWFIDTHDKRRRNNQLKKRQNSGIEEKSKELVLKFIQSKYTIDEFSSANQISSSEFQSAVRVVKSCDLDLYNKYSSFQLERNKRRFRQISVSLQEISFLINEGILLDDNTTRKFDFIDYYQRTSLDINEVKKVFNNITLSPQEKRTIIGFLSKTNMDRPLNISSTLESIVEINLRKDENGLLIPGSGRIVTRQEKQAIIDWIKDNHLPCTNFVYRDAFNRYKRGQLFKKEEQKDSGGKYRKE